MPLILLRKCFQLGSKLRVVRDGINWELDLDEGIDLAIFLFGCFEPSTNKALKKLVKPGNVVLDIGANIGAHTLTLARLVGAQGKVIAFEPTLYAFRKASLNIKLNPQLAPSIKLEQVLLSDSDKSIPDTLYSSWPLVGSEGLHEKHGGCGKETAGANVISIDDYLESNNVKQVQFIKLDVDGYECKVLRGAKRLLETQKPTMVMELCPHVLEEHGETLEELVAILKTTGYRMFQESSEKELPLDADKLNALVADGSGINVIVK